MSNAENTTNAEAASAPQWRPLTARQRRVLVTLMEKSKTTPDSYPMTYLGLTTGCNQKSNRNPVNNYTQEQIEETVEQLREFGAVVIIQGNGRVEKVRHNGYQWMGLTKVEAAIMTELLLRGEQSVGELRTRASRMEAIPDLGELQRLLTDLRNKKLVVFLTPAGRGQMVTHNLYQDHELQQIRATVQSGGSSPDDDDDEPEITPRPAAIAPTAPALSSQAPSPTPTPSMGVTRSYSTVSPAASATSSVAEKASISGPSLQDFQELQLQVKTLTARIQYLEEQLGVTPPQ